MRSLPARLSAADLHAARRLSFVENRGQWPCAAPFVVERGPLTARLERDGLGVRLRDGSRTLLLELTFEGASEDVSLLGEDPQPGRRNFLLGADPAGWHGSVQAYASVLYRGLYPGIDLRVRDLEGRLEYDVLLSPGADLSAFRVRCEGVEGLRFDADGTLVLETSLGPVTQSPPRTWYQLASGAGRPVECRFVARDEWSYGFEIPERDPRLDVVIDPGLEYSTFLGGSDADVPQAVAWHAASGRVFVAGSTFSAGFPTTPGVHDPGPPESEEAFVVCLDPARAGEDQLVWATYLGGTLADRIMDIALDAGGDVCAVGLTDSPDFPVTPGAFSESPQGGWDAFVARLDGATGASLSYSTRLGGSGDDLGVVIVHEDGDKVLIGGTLDSADLPVTAGALQPAIGGGTDAFVARLDMGGQGTSDLLYATYLGGSGPEGWLTSASPWSVTGSMGLEADASGRVYVTGTTWSADFPVTPDAYDDSPGLPDAFVSCVVPSGGGASDLAYSTFLGGFGYEFGRSLALDPTGTLIIAGSTDSGDFPTTPGAHNEVTGTLEGAAWDNGFLTWLDIDLPAEEQLVYSTYFGWFSFDWVQAIVSDGAGGVVAVGGYGGGILGPTVTTCTYSGYVGAPDAVLFHLVPDGNGFDDLRYSTVLGGTGSDTATSVALIEGGGIPRAVCAIGTSSADFPTTSGAFEPLHQGGDDVAVVLFELAPAVSTYCTAGTSASGCQASLSAVGIASTAAASGFELNAYGAEGQKAGIFYFGTSGRQASSWGNGTSYQCVVPPVKRLGLLAGGGAAGVCDGWFSQDLNAVWCPTCPKPLHNPGPGAMVQAQLWYRDPLSTSNQSTSLSDALEFCVGP